MQVSWKTACMIYTLLLHDVCIVKGKNVKFTKIRNRKMYQPKVISNISSTERIDPVLDRGIICDEKLIIYGNRKRSPHELKHFGKRKLLIIV